MSNNRVTLRLINIGDPGNKADNTPAGAFGNVDKEFRLSETETTVSQYTAFLNAVAKYTRTPEDAKIDKATYAYLEGLYDQGMGSPKLPLKAQIERK
jgi:hypothetical protein